MTAILKNMAKRSDFGVSLATVALFSVFAMASDSFLTSYNMFNISRNVALYIFIAIPQAIVIAIGGMNLSIGAIGGFSVIIAGYLMETLQWNPALAAIAALAFGAALGLLNGMLIAKLKLNSFIVTLSTMFLFTGFVYGISKGFPFTKIPASFTWIGRKGLGPVPNLLILAIIVLVILAYVLRYTVFGRHLLAVGGNPEAARLSGVNVSKITIGVHTLSGFMASLAGVLTLSRIGSAQPATGQNWMIVSFAVSILGATALTGGSMTALGLFMGAVMMVMIKNGLVLMEANVYYEQAFIGGIILLAVVVGRIGALMRKS